MDAKDYVVNEVLRDSRRFLVPIYQRQYQWGPSRLDPLWDDIAAKAEEVLQGQKGFMHYMGALILAPTGDGDKFAITPSIQVVDGQQRLTSFQLFLAAVRDTARQLGIPDIDPAVKDYLFNSVKAKDTDANARFKLTPTPSDRSIFWTLIEKGREGARDALPHVFYKNGNLKKGLAPASLVAYDLLLERIEQFVRTGRSYSDASSDPEADHLPAERLNALLDALLSRMKLVVIELDEDDDAQVIFETLNSKAEPLLAMDLVRNNIFHRAERQGIPVGALHADLWQPFDTPFWRADAPRARPVRPRIEHFLAHALTAQTGSAVSMRELYAEYRSFTRPKGKERFESVADELRALTRFALAYRTLEGDRSDDPDLAWIGRKLAAWQVTTAYPVIFQIAVSNLEHDERRAMYETIYAYIVRRGLCLLGSKNLNNVFQRVVALFLSTGVTPRVLSTALVDQSGTAGRFPSDDELRAAILGQSVYGRLDNPRLGDVLWELEVHARSSKSEDLPRPPALWIEHVMPQSWQEHWPLDGLEDSRANDSDPLEVSAISRRTRLVGSLGNLTLTTAALDIALSNAAFEEKKTLLGSYTLLALNKWILDQPNWNEARIEQRGGLLARMAVARWAFPRL